MHARGPNHRVSPWVTSGLRRNVHLRDLIVAGRVKPSVVVSHRLPLAGAPAAFRRFDRREDGYIKVVLDPMAGRSEP